MTILAFGAGILLAGLVLMLTVNALGDAAFGPKRKGK